LRISDELDAFLRNPNKALVGRAHERVIKEENRTAQHRACDLNGFAVHKRSKEPALEESRTSKCSYRQCTVYPRLLIMERKRNSKSSFLEQFRSESEVIPCRGSDCWLDRLPCLASAPASIGSWLTVPKP
jgi:hypothetical protein